MNAEDVEFEMATFITGPVAVSVLKVQHNAYLATSPTHCKIELK